MTPLQISLFGLLVALNGADVLTTVHILGLGGQEMNPLLAPLMRRVGVLPALLGYKVPALALLYWIAAPVWLLGWLCLAFVVICGNNGWQLIKARNSRV